MSAIRRSLQKWQHFSDENKSKSTTSHPRSRNLTFRPIIISSTQQNADNNNNSSTSSAGRIKRVVLTKQGRTKANSNPDREFYAYPRLVTHVDNKFISKLTDLYREILRPEMEILDLMSSWVSHLPQEVNYNKVVGHGLNAEELSRNPRLDYFFVKDLNIDQQLQMQNDTFDAVLCTVSVQYLQQPEKVFAEIFRVLRPGGVLVVSFSNRLFYEKAISAWRDGTAYSRVQLVVEYFQCVEGFTQTQIIRKLGDNDDNNSILSRISGLLGFLSGSSDPFYAVIAYKNFKPIYD
ncbi:hypothetical protein ABFS83_08G003500 [Erythranthe nasuta]